MEPWSSVELSRLKAYRRKSMNSDQLRTEVDNSLARIYRELE